MLSLFSFQGRINRLQFLGLQLVQIAVMMTLILVFVAVAIIGRLNHAPVFATILGAAVGIAGLWMSYATSWKRMTDIGVPRSLRRLLQFGWTIAGAILMARFGHTLLVKLLVGSVPFAMLALWPGQSDQDYDIPPQAEGPPPASNPLTPSPSPGSARPAQAAFTPRPVGADGRPVFGRRGLSPAPR